MKDGFDSWHSARHWVIYGSKDYLREKGVPEGAKLNIVGENTGDTKAPIQGGDGAGFQLRKG
jgi:hypothetical protein